MRLRFGDCLLDTSVRDLKRDGETVPLSPKAFRLLEVLAERRPSAVSQEELRSVLWPDTAGGTTLARLVSEVRTAIGDGGGSGEAIRTVHRFGYAFAAAATDQTRGAGTAGCAIQWGSQLVALTAGENIIGRSPDALINVASPKVSRRHARILVAGDRATLEDLGSRNGTYLGEQLITARVDLKQGDRIGIGPAMLIFYACSDDAVTATQTQAKQE